MVKRTKALAAYRKAVGGYRSKKTGKMRLTKSARRSLKQDRSKSAKKVGFAKWKKNPTKYDLKGSSFDSKKRRRRR